MTIAHETYTSATDYLTKRLRQELKAMDEHEKETRRLLDASRRAEDCPPPGVWDERAELHRNLSARVIETARALSVVLP